MTATSLNSIDYRNRVPRKAARRVSPGKASNGKMACKVTLRPQLRSPSSRIALCWNEEMIHVLCHFKQNNNAVMCLKRGLAELKKGRLATPKSPSAASSSCPAYWGQIRLQEGPPMSAHHETVSPEGAFLFYNRVFGCDRADVDTTSAILLYNLAYMCHRDGLFKAGSPRNLRKALQLYSMAMRKRPQLRELGFAAVNNMGHIHSCLFQMEAAQACQYLLHNKRMQLSMSRIISPTEYCMTGQRLQCAPSA